MVTHEHLDHIRGLDGLKKCGIDIYLSRGTKETLSFNLGHRENIVRPKELFKIGSFQILPFDVQHDAKEPLGFLVQSILTQEKLLYATDTYYLKYKFSGLNYLLIECNYILEILESNLKSGATPLTVRDRLIESHFSLANLKEFFKANDLSKVKEIWLIHMSQSNCDENRAKREIQELTGKPVYIA